MDRRQYAVEKVTAYRNLSELERDSLGVSNGSGTNLYQSGLQAGQRPVGHLLRQISALQEAAIGHYLKMLQCSPSLRPVVQSAAFCRLNRRCADLCAIRGKRENGSWRNWHLHGSVITVLHCGS